MHNLITSSAITEGKAMSMFFDACRGNPQRNEWKGPEGFTVQFFKVAGKFLAIMRDKWGGWTASASVDEFDN